jgi:hypothetical protein
MRIRVPARRILMGLSLVGGLAACEFGMTSVPSYLANTSGSQQVVAPGAQAPKPLVVTVKDQDGDAIDNVDVIWSIDQGAGTLSSTSTSTSGSGQASVNYTAGTTVGTTLISARVPSLGAAVSFTITVK